MVFIDFVTPQSEPSKKMMPMFDSLKAKFKDTMTIVKINVDASRKLMKDLGICQYSIFVLDHKGKILFIYNGIKARKDIIKIFE